MPSNSLIQQYDANSVWRENLINILDFGDNAHPRGLQCHEIIGYHSVVNMHLPVITWQKRKMGYHFLAAEAYWILTGDNRVETIVPYAPKIAQFSDDGRRFQGAYGPKVTEQLKYIIDTLAADEHSRQAVINIWRENPRPSRDIPCTLSLQFLIRPHIQGSLLNCIATMRSSDLWLGWVYDVFNFTMIAAYVALCLINGGRIVHLGKLHINAGSQHLYGNNLDAAMDLIHDDIAGDYRPLELSHFNSPESLLVHLGHLKDNPVDLINLLVPYGSRT